MQSSTVALLRHTYARVGLMLALTDITDRVLTAFRAEGIEMPSGPRAPAVQPAA